MGWETIAGLALAAGGTAAQMSAASGAQAASNREIEAALNREKGFQAQASPIFDKSLQETAKGPAQVDQGQLNAQNLYNQVQKIPLSSVASPLPVDEQRLQGQLQGQQQAQARGQGYADMGMLQWLKNQEANRQLGVISNLAHTSAMNTGTLAQLAQQPSASLAGIGSLMSTAGNLAGIYGGLNRGSNSLGHTALQNQYGPQ